MERCSAILMPVSSLPSPYGIGSFGKAAYYFADFLHAAGQSCWQLLPLGPTSYGDSPYSSPSSFAGNPYFIDLDLLAEDGLLTREDLDGLSWGDDPRHVDYGPLYEARYAVLAKAKERGWDRDRAAVETFAAQNRDWLADYALYMALKRHFDMKSWMDWPDEAARLHRPEALETWRARLREDVDFFTYIQFLFFRQWEKLKSYVNGLGIRIIGDLPIYVALDSADVWAAPDMFQLDERGYPTEVSGVPPDYFNADGQLWGNPLYNYAAMERDGFQWWIRRVGGVARLFDVIRIDHFRGFESYWAVPYGDTTARRGRWVKGPGMKLVGVLTSWFHNLEFIAEDLGYATPEVAKLLRDSGLPSMKVLEFAFSPDGKSDHLPHTHSFNTTCYTATHDNAPLALWKKTEATKAELKFAKEYGGFGSGKDFNDGVIRLGMRSAAMLFVAQMQDWLELAEGCRMNLPGTLGGNWTWRMLPGEATPELASRIHELTRIFARLPREKEQAENREQEKKD
ncbi:MAG: 4-alpha-glucanotransferase [Oscillospiraceae bacterium]|nr:4-alpha-glucanotransferase [Oscillospiraceae bacterium]